MKINNQLITSLEAFKSKFNFIEIWNKIDIVVRDLSPNELYYKNATDIIFHKVIESPNLYKIVNNSIKPLDGSNIEFPVDAKELSFLDGLTEANKIRIIALYRLAQKDIPADICLLAATTIAGDTDEIILKFGNQIKLSDISVGPNMELTHKLIKVSPEATTKSKVGNITLKPGQATFGVFSGSELVAVSPAEDYNKAFYLEYAISQEGVKLIVHDQQSGLIVAEYPKAHYFTLIGDNNFAVIDGLSVTCFVDEDLNRRIKKSIERIFAPQIIVADERTLTVTYKDGTSQIITL